MSESGYHRFESTFNYFFNMVYTALCVKVKTRDAPAVSMHENF